MAIDVSQLTIKVISDGIDKATNSLNKLAEASTKVESSTMVVKTSTDAANTATSNAAKVTTSYIDRLQAKVDLLGKNNAQAAAYTATQKGLADGEIRLAESLGAKLDAWKAMAKVQEEAIAMNKAFIESEDATSKRLRQVALDAMSRAEAQNAEIASQRLASVEVAKAAGYSQDLVKAQNAQMASAVKVVDVNNSVSAAFANSRKAVKQQVETMGDVIASISPAERGLQKLADAEERLHAAFQKGPKDEKEYAEGLALIAAQRTTLVEKQAAAVAKATEDASKGAASLLTNAGAMREFFVILREGVRGDFTRMAGSISILVDRLSLMGAALAILTSPITWVIGALAGVGIIALQGADETNKFNQALILTGNYAGITASQMELAAAGMKNIAGQHAAAQALTEVANTGKFAGDQVEMVGKAALEMNQMTGTAVKDTVKQFEELAKNPVEAIFKLNDQYHFLTASVYEQIRSLEEQGKYQEAATLAMKTYADAIDQRRPQIIENLGLIEKGWKHIKEEATAALNAIMNIGRADIGQARLRTDLAEKLAANEKTVAFYKNNGNNEMANSYEQGSVALRAQIDAIDAANKATDAQAKQAAAQTELTQAGVKAQKEIDDRNEHTKGAIRLEAQLLKIRQDFATLHKADPTAKALKGVNFDADGNPISGGEYAEQVEAAKKKNKISTPRGNDYAIDKLIQDNKNAIQALVDSTKLGMNSVKAQYDRGEIDTETFLQKDYLLKADAYVKELALAEKNLEIASKKKNVTAISQANKEIQKLQDAAVKDAQDYTDSLANIEAKRKRDIDKYTETLIEAYNARQAQIDNYINSAGMSVPERDLMARQEQVMTEYRDRMKKLREDLEKTESHGGISQTTFDEKADKAYDEMQLRIAQEKKFTSDKLKLQSDWVVGAKTAYNDYKNNVDDVAAQTQNAFNDAFKGMEDVLTNFIRTGKLSFGSLVDTILADMARVEAKKFMSSLMGDSSGGSSVFGALIGMLGGGMSSGMSDAGIISSGVASAGGILGGAYANGGDPPLNVPSLVGENGPELFVPKQAGTIVPNEQLGGSGGTSITYAPTIHIDSRADRAQVMQDVQNAVKAGNAQLVDDLKRRRVI